MSPLLLGLLVGMAFGAALSLSGLSNPGLLLEMLRLRDLRLLKVLVTALGTGIVGIALLDAGGLAHTGVKTLHLAAILAGGGIFGLGFALAGYCPGSAIAALGEGRRDALAVVLGGLLGTAIFAFSYDAVKPLLLEPWTLGKPTLPSVLGVHPLLVALPLGAGAAWLVAAWLRSGRRPAAAASRE
ncbi:MAG: YeeE/YedE family protein [Planctomycetes bacterium]|nr:YeeE/YedE family protein [Planctomycetota bacterium]